MYMPLMQAVNRSMTSRSLFPAAVVIGNESQGISEALLSKATVKIGIPSVSGSAESLNASVAAGILCSEFTRKLRSKTDHSVINH